MDEDQLKDSDSDDKFGAALPLPTEAQPLHSKPSSNHTSSDNSPHTDSKAEDQSLAADVIRKKVEAAYKHEPSLAAEAEELSTIRPQSKHQRFVQELINSGQPLAETQAAWHQYYGGLSDAEKHQVWQEFYTNQSHGPSYIAGFPAQSTVQSPQPYLPTPRHRRVKSPRAVDRKLAEFKQQLINKVPAARNYKPPKHVQSALVGLAAGAIVIIIVLFSFFNERFIAPFIQPSRNITNTPLISDTVASANPEVVIPKINVEIPVVYNVNTIDESAIDGALEGGVVHYADTAVPGQDGNVVIVGHSSNNIFNKGKYKFAFVLLNRLEVGDTFYLQKDGKRYTYQVYQKSIVNPDDVSVLGGNNKPATASLITCDPPGTSLHRLVVVGEQISPDPLANAPKATNNTLATQSRIVPGNAPSLWHRFSNWFTQ